MELYESIVQAIDQQYQQYAGEITQQQISRRAKLRQGQALFQTLHLYTYLPQ